MKPIYPLIFALFHFLPTSMMLADQPIHATLLSSQEFELVSGSKTIGSIKAPANSKVKVHETKENEMLVSFGGSKAIWLSTSVLQVAPTTQQENVTQEVPPVLTDGSASKSTASPNTTAEKPKPDFFSFSATSKARKKGSERGVGDDGINFGYSTLEISLYFSIFFTRGPSNPYTLEVFFIAQDKSTRNLYIYDYFTKEYTDSSVKGEVEALPLRRSGGKWISFQGTAYSHELRRDVDATLTYRQPIPKSEFKGWIARVVSGGIPLKVEGNDGLLLDMAKKNPGLLTEIAKQQ